MLLAVSTVLCSFRKTSRRGHDHSQRRHCTVCMLQTCVDAYHRYVRHRQTRFCESAYTGMQLVLTFRIYQLSPITIPRTRVSSHHMHASPISSAQATHVQTLPCCACVHVSVHSETNGMCAMEFTMLTRCCGQECLQGSRPGRLAQCQRLAGQAQMPPSCMHILELRDVLASVCSYPVPSILSASCTAHQPTHNSPATQPSTRRTAAVVPHINIAHQT